MDLDSPLAIEWIRQRVKAGEYLLTLHADEERRNDNFEFADLEATLLGGSVLEEYPDDPRGPSCLLHGRSRGIPIHVVCGRNRSGWLVVITVYRPAPPKWDSPTQRRKS